MAKKPEYPEHLKTILGDSPNLQDEIARIMNPPFQSEPFHDMLERQAQRVRDFYGIADANLWHRAATSVVPRVAEFESELSDLRREVRKQAETVRTHAADSAKAREEAEALRTKLTTLEERERVAHLLNRVGETAQTKILEDESFQLRFQDGQPCDAFVVAVDIRRSTELMLRAREPRLFAEFTITLATALRQIMVNNYGIFDKFTGDGVLAFFPDFFSGEDAGYRALIAAEQCHAIFAEHYRRHRSAFQSVMLDTGLGIGIDHGAIHIVQIQGEFTVVGAPVVYACRMAGAEGGRTCVNQPAYDRLFARYASFDFAETEIEIKHEGRTAAYFARQNGKPYVPAPPSWETPPPDTAPSSALKPTPTRAT